MRARPATLDDVEAICRICADGWRDTYAVPGSEVEIEDVVASFYTPGRVAREVDAALPSWGGWFVAEADSVIAAGAGGMTGAASGEVFVLCADPARRGEGAGTAVLQAVTAQQLALGATEQWVSVEIDNTKGIGFYEARGFVRRGTQSAYAMQGESARYRRSLTGQGSGKPRGSD